ncbi:winged helix DNA-binding domain-containing protein [Streptomyces sp. WMMC500]|uniref:winged helix DNA-binding domain-containing protein n=1 Tax=Streptomyces sp. WMMC500 TaxID=3015154 RepID=UPI00248AD81F|nr:winged helix DNA-binding domain-containing protein [Streptomyces sp. WMMC500]WBB63674.1 winged helix DNA-binding domain-containing protein [Streptomyces sp. WMMC500]
MTGPGVLLARARAQCVAGGVRCAGAEEMVERVFAVQAQDIEAAALGLRARTHGLTRTAVRAALEERRTLFRGWFMRGTLHLVPAADVHWLLGLYGPRLVSRAARRYRDLGLDEGLCERAERAVVDAVAAHGPLTRAELAARLARLGVEPDGQAPIHVIRRTALAGLVCHGPLRAGEPTYVALRDWLPPPTGPQPAGDDAVRELVRRYLRGHGPAGPDDFAAWSGLPAGAARRVWPEGPAGAAPGVPSGAGGSYPTPDVRLLPAYDDYWLGWRDRDAAIPRDVVRAVRPGGGQIRAAVTVNGRAAGTWTRQRTGNAQVRMFAEGSDRVEADVTAEAADVARFLQS